MTTVSMRDADIDHQVEDVVLGVETHKDIHVAAVLTLVGGHIAHASFPTTAAGYQQLIAWVRFFGEARRAGVEGTGSYGFALARELLAEGLTVLEFNRPDRAVRRRRGKTDTIDAENAARAVLAGEATAVPKAADGPVEMLRVSRTRRRHALSRPTKSKLLFVIPGARLTAEVGRVRRDEPGLGQHSLGRGIVTGGGRPQCAQPVPRHRQSAQLSDGRGRHAPAGDVPRDSVAELSGAIPEPVQVEPAQNRAILGNEHIEGATAGLLLGRQGAVPARAPPEFTQMRP